jgi:CHAT domain-containing protein
LRWASKGLPIADWWDVDRLLSTLLSYLAPRIAAEHGLDEAARHIREVFGITADPVVDALIKHPLEPPPLPGHPSDLKVGKDADVGGLDFLADLASRPRVGEYIAGVRARSLLGGGAPARPGGWELGVGEDVDAWLAEAQATTVAWKILSEITQFIADGGEDDLSHDHFREVASFGPESLAGATLIAAQAWDRCAAWLDGLSQAERTLIREQDERMLRRRRWLDGHLRIHHAPLLVPDAVPDVTVPGDVLTVPAWVRYEVFDLGGRIMHDSSGPLTLWWVVVETDEDEKDLALQQYAFHEVGVSEDGGTVILDLKLGQGEIHDSALAPFRFEPEDPQSGVELLLVALAGARLDFYRLRDDRELQHLGSTVIRFPTGSLTPFIDRLDAVLARAEAEEPGVPPFAVLARREESAPLWFAMMDNAKSGDILFDIGLFSAKADADARGVAAARTALSRAELARVSIEANGVTDVTARSHAEQARHAYHILRQKVPRAVGRQVADLVTGVVTSGRAFVQFGNVEEYPAGLVAIQADGGPKVELLDLSHVTVDQVQKVSDLWFALASHPSWEQAADVLDTVLRWVGREIMNPVSEMLQAVGIQHVVLCPTRALEPIPLRAAPLGDRTVGDFFQVSYAPSAAVLSRLAATSARTVGLDLIVESSGAYAPAELGLPVLQGPGQEAQALHRIAPRARIIGDADASPGDVLAAIAASHVAHLAGHGRSHADELASGIWLAGPTPGSALLSAAQVHAGPLMRDTSLVVLSACETARHPVGGPAIQAWRGLDSAFLSRGARAVVSSLWDISDLAALIYNIAFHIRLSESVTIADAHTAATSALRTAAIDPRAAGLLDWVRPHWRRDVEAFDLDRAYWWSAYRPSGVCW